MNTADLISNLSSKATPVKTLKKPSYLVLQFMLFSVAYYTAIQTSLGARGDIIERFSQPFFTIEIGLILLLLFSCLVTAVLTIYPDNYQKSFLLKSPYLVLLALFCFFIGEFFLLNQTDLTASSGHNFECTLCIAGFAIIPSLYFFYILRKGVNMNPHKAGAFTIIAATAISAIALRVSEHSDGISHMLIWHYFPILVFSLIGAFIAPYVVGNPRGN